MSRRIDAFVVATPGLEVLVQGELTRLGVRPANVTHGGVNCSLTWPQLWAVHLKSRIATRVLVRVARFKADGFDTLQAGLARIVVITAAFGWTTVARLVRAATLSLKTRDFVRAAIALVRVATRSPDW